MKFCNRFSAVLAAGVLAFSVGVTTPAHAAPPAKPDPAAQASEALALNEKYWDTPVEEIPAEDLAKLQQYGSDADAKVKNETKILFQAEDGGWEAATGTDGITTFTANTCYTARYYRTVNHVLGYALYSSWTTGRWCTNSNNAVTSASSVEHGGSTHFLGWNFKGRTNGGAGVVSGQGRAWNQHHFFFQLGTPYVTQNVYPCTRVRGYNTGTYYRDTTCSLY